MVVYSHRKKKKKGISGKAKKKRQGVGGYLALY